MRLVPLGTKDRQAHRALKETRDQLGLLVPKGNRASQDHQVSQDHLEDQVLPANLEGKASLGSRVKKAMMVHKALRDQLDPQAHQAPLG